MERALYLFTKELHIFRTSVTSNLCHWSPISAWIKKDESKVSKLD